MQYANRFGYTDIEPFEVVKTTAKTITIREMDAQLDPAWKPEFIAGGFAGHCVNSHAQRWIITSNPRLPVFKAHLRKDGYYHSLFGAHKLADKPIKFHDYNF